MKSQNPGYSDIHLVWYPRRDSLRLAPLSQGKLTSQIFDLRSESTEQ